MANYSTLKAAIAQVIKTNGNNEITGNLLQQQLLSMVNSLGAGYQYAGVATPATDPGTPDARVFYLASTPGTYTNFGSIVLANDEVAVLKWDVAWHKEVTGVYRKPSYGIPKADLNNTVQGLLDKANVALTSIRGSIEDASSPLYINLDVAPLTFLISGANASAWAYLVKCDDMGNTHIPEITLLAGDNALSFDVGDDDFGGAILRISSEDYADIMFTSFSSLKPNFYTLDGKFQGATPISVRVPYIKPSTGIPASDLASEVQTTLQRVSMSAYRAKDGTVSASSPLYINLEHSVRTFLISGGDDTGEWAYLVVSGGVGYLTPKVSLLTGDDVLLFTEGYDESEEIVLRISVSSGSRIIHFFPLEGNKTAEFYSLVGEYSTSHTIQVSRLYNKPSAGIPKADLASAVQMSLNEADSALKEREEVIDDASPLYIDLDINALSEYLIGGNTEDGKLFVYIVRSDSLVNTYIPEITLLAGDNILSFALGSDSEIGDAMLRISSSTSAKINLTSLTSASPSFDVLGGDFIDATPISVRIPYVKPAAGIPASDLEGLKKFYLSEAAQGYCFDPLAQYDTYLELLNHDTTQETPSFAVEAIRSRTENDKFILSVQLANGVRQNESDLNAFVPLAIAGRQYGNMRSGNVLPVYYSRHIQVNPKLGYLKANDFQIGNVSIGSMLNGLRIIDFQGGVISDTESFHGAAFIRAGVDLFSKMPVNFNLSALDMVEDTVSGYLGGTTIQSLVVKACWAEATCIPGGDAVPIQNFNGYFAGDVTDENGDHHFLVNVMY